MVTAKPLRHQPGASVVPRLLRGVPVADLSGHLALWGEMARVDGRLIDEVGRSGLRGRGGGGFPLARKLAAAAAGVAGTVVINAAESEPVSTKDRTLLAANPHLVLDGAGAAAAATGASEILLCVERNREGSLRPLLEAVRERMVGGLDRVRVRLATAPSRYVAGQETALVRWLNGGDARPTTVPPRPSDRGVGGRPTLVSNAETLAHLALVARFGAEWFRALGTAEAPGTALVTVGGDVARAGVYEVPLGVPIAEILSASGGDAAASGGLLVGGYFGAWLPPSAGATRLDDLSLAPWGAGVGCGAVMVLPAGTCGLRESARVLRYLAGESAGQCGPCINGLPAIATAMEAVVAGDPGGRAHADLLRWADMVDGRGACAMPDGAARLLRSTLSVFAADVDAHRARGACGAAPPLLPTPAPGPWR
jgi:NADH:ubiquinone oxidoreductase subunit F (NADH-binding)